LLAFLLDGLSEDLNRIHGNKPYTINPDSAGRPDQELADIWWENHLKRDRSVIQALFTGQFKSVMNCSQCGHTSASFEPFTFLTVPIPEDGFRVVQLIVVPRKLELTCRVAVRVPKTGTLEDVVSKVTTLGIEGIDSESLLIGGELHLNYRIKSFIHLDRRLKELKETEFLVFFQVTAIPKKLEKYFLQRQEQIRKQLDDEEQRMKKKKELMKKKMSDDHHREEDEQGKQSFSDSSKILTANKEEQQPQRKKGEIKENNEELQEEEEERQPQNENLHQQEQEENEDGNSVDPNHRLNPSSNGRLLHSSQFVSYLFVSSLSSLFSSSSSCS
jgi:hypothetical protein